MWNRRLLVPLLAPLALLLIGTFGYKWIEGPPWTWLDALYMATITLTTIGYGETHPLSPNGRVFTIFFCLGGIFSLTYLASEIIRFMVSGEMQEILGRRRMEKQLAALSDHYIVCGYGRMGQYVCKEFEERGLKYVVVDLAGETERDFPTKHGLFVLGDAASDEVLHRAGVTRAKALVTVAASDADNLYIVLSARLLNAKLFIVARAEETAAEEKLRKVGADRVISPYVIGGSRVAQAALRPTLVDFLDLATRSDPKGLHIEEIRLQTESPLVGRTLEAAKLTELGLTIVAIQRPSGELATAPLAAHVLEPNDVLIVLGQRDQLQKLEQLAVGPA